MKRPPLIALALLGALALLAPAGYPQTGCEPGNAAAEKARMQQYMKRLEECLTEQEADADCRTEFYNIKDAFDEFLNPPIRLEAPPPGEPLRQDECPDTLLYQNVPEGR